jgi:hypothetical protein
LKAWGIPLAGNVGRSTTVQEKQLALYSAPCVYPHMPCPVGYAVLIEALKGHREVLGWHLLSGS